MHLYQASLEGHESREEAQWARVPTLFLGQNGGPRAKKNYTPPPFILLPCTYFYAEFFCSLNYLL